MISNQSALSAKSRQAMDAARRRSSGVSRPFLKGASAIALATAPMFGAAQAACTVTYEDGTTYTDTSVASCGNYYSSAHPCSASSGRPAACATQDMFKAVNWSASQNLINNVKKGLWHVDIFDDAGNKNGVVQNTSICAFKVEESDRAPNTVRSYIASYTAGWKSAEVDTSLMFDAANYNSSNPGAIYDTTSGSANAQTYIGHYKDYWASTTWGDNQKIVTPNANSPANLGFTWNTSRQEANTQLLYQKHMFNHQFQLPAGTDRTKDLYLRAIDLIKDLAGTRGYTDMVMLFDPKAGPPPRVNVNWGQTNQSGGNVAKATPTGGDIQGLNGTCGAMKCADRVILAQSQELVHVYSTNSTYTPYKANIVLKTTLDANTIINNIPNWEQFSWVPLTNNFETDGKKYLEFVQDWIDLAGKSVLYIDNNNNGADWWYSQSFRWNDSTKTFGSGTLYDDSHDFIRKYSQTKLGYGLRPQFWPVTPVRPTGNVGDYIAETTVKPSKWNEYSTGPGTAANESDLWTDPSGHYTEKYAAWAVVTHDRPDIYLQHRNQAGGVDCQARGDG